LEAVPKNWYGVNFHLQQENKLVGEVNNSHWRERARLELEDGSYELRRERFCAGDFFLERDGKVIARASKPSFFKCTFDVELPNRLLSLRKISRWKLRFGLFEGEKQIGSVYALGSFGRRMEIDLPADLSLPVRSFLFWLVFLIWRRQQQAVA
jgi:hypothetical protein